jgi:cytidylate kinase
LKDKGKVVSLEAVVADVKARDERDRSRAVSPLVPAADALLLDNSAQGIEETVARVLAHVHSII